MTDQNTPVSDWSASQLIVARGAIQAFALYLGGILVASLVWDYRWGTVAAIVAIGLAMVNYAAWFNGISPKIARLLWVATNLSGIVAGLVLLGKVIL